MYYHTDNMTPNYNFKIVLVGDTGVGKTSLVEILIYGERINEYTDPTVGAAFSTKKMTIKGTELKLQIWDTAGQERFRTLCPMYTRDSAGCICVFSVMDANSFQNLEKWIKEYRERNPYSGIVVAANKVDHHEDTWAVTQEMMKEFSKTHNVHMMCTSGKTGENVAELFNRLCEQIVVIGSTGIASRRNIASSSSTKGLVQLEIEPTIAQTNCCTLL